MGELAERAGTTIKTSALAAGVAGRRPGQQAQMGSNLSDGFAIYSMEEDEATGAVAGVYAQLLTRMPFVPSLVKSFALCPQ